MDVNKGQYEYNLSSPPPGLPVNFVEFALTGCLVQRIKQTFRHLWGTRKLLCFCASTPVFVHFPGGSSNYASSTRCFEQSREPWGTLLFLRIAQLQCGNACAMILWQLLTLTLPGPDPVKCNTCWEWGNTSEQPRILCFCATVFHQPKSRAFDRPFRNLGELREVHIVPMPPCCFGFIEAQFARWHESFWICWTALHASCQVVWCEALIEISSGQKWIFQSAHWKTQQWRSTQGYQAIMEPLKRMDMSW